MAARSRPRVSRTPRTPRRVRSLATRTIEARELLTRLEAQQQMGELRAQLRRMRRKGV